MARVFRLLLIVATVMISGLIVLGNMAEEPREAEQDGSLTSLSDPSN